MRRSRTRLACAVIPLFPLAARLRSEPELLGEALVIFEGNAHNARVIAATRTARQAGVRPGLSLPQARALMPALIARARDADCEATAQETLLEVAETISPRVESFGDGIVHLDIQGLEQHYRRQDPEIDLGHTLLRDLDAVGLPARVGIAGNKLAARIAAELPHTPTIVPAGEEAVFLAPLPLERLAPAIEVAATLSRWGVRSIGELASLPRSEVSSRLGEMGRILHESARGLDSEPLIPRQPPPVFREGMSLEWPLVTLEPLLHLFEAALRRLCRRLDTQGLGCLRLAVALKLEPTGRHERCLSLPSPTRDVRTLLELLRLDLEAVPPGAPVIGFRFDAHPDRPRTAQLSLFGPSSLSPEKLATTLARLFTLVGKGRVGSPAEVDGHLPERFAMTDYAPPPPPQVRPHPPSARGLLIVRALKPAIPLEVGLGRTPPNDSSIPSPCALRPRPEAAQTTQIAGDVRVASGPWHLEEGWWKQNPAQRDYWDVEMGSGELLRIYQDRQTQRWFMDGIYD